MIYFFDTYALLETIKGNPNYREYEKEEIITTRLNLMELYYTLLRLFDEQIANYYFDFFLPASVPVENGVIKAAMKFRLEQRKKKNLISYVDCIGYFVALQSSVRLLTGEKHFLGLRNVEFVK
jgi:predicted nucleic acid-binding protein